MLYDLSVLVNIFLILFWSVLIFDWDRFVDVLCVSCGVMKK